MPNSGILLSIASHNERKQSAPKSAKQSNNKETNLKSDSKDPNSTARYNRN